MITFLSMAYQYLSEMDISTTIFGVLACATIDSAKCMCTNNSEIII